MAVVVMIDTMIFDEIAGSKEMQEAIRRSQESSHIEIVSTRIQSSQLSSIPTDRNIGQSEALNTRKLNSAVFILDFSILDEDRLGSDEASAAFNHIQAGSSKHTEDAVIGATAFENADILVTNDKRLRKRFKELGSRVKAMTGSEFLGYLESLA